MYRLQLIIIAVILLPVQLSAATPNLVITTDDVKQMRKAITHTGRFSDKYHRLKAQIDQHSSAPSSVPLPTDGGGGYSHEQHKNNYQLMFNAAVIYQLSQQAKYANLVKNKSSGKTLTQTFEYHHKTYHLDDRLGVYLLSTKINKH